MQDVLRQIAQGRQAIFEQVKAQKTGDIGYLEEMRKFHQPTTEAIAKQTEQQALTTAEQTTALTAAMKAQRKKLKQTINNASNATVAEIAKAVAEIKNTNTIAQSTEELTQQLLNMTGDQRDLLKAGFASNLAAQGIINESLKVIQSNTQPAPAPRAQPPPPKSILLAPDPTNFTPQYKDAYDTIAKQINRKTNRNPVYDLFPNDPDFGDAVVATAPTPDNTGFQFVVTKGENEYRFDATPGLAHFLTASSGSFKLHPVTTPSDAMIYLDILRLSGSTGMTGTKVKEAFAVLGTKINNVAKQTLRQEMQAVGNPNEPSKTAIKRREDELKRIGPTAFGQAYGIPYQTLVETGTVSHPAPQPPVSQPSFGLLPTADTDYTKWDPADFTAVRGEAFKEFTSGINSQTPRNDDLDFNPLTGALGRAVIEPRKMQNIWLFRVAGPDIVTSLKATPGLAILIGKADDDITTADDDKITAQDAMAYFDILRQGGVIATGKKTKIISAKIGPEIARLTSSTSDADPAFQDFLDKGPTAWAAANNADIKNVIGDIVSFQGATPRRRNRPSGSGVRRPKPPKPPHKAGPSHASNAYKIGPVNSLGWAPFGDIHINMRKLNRHPPKLSVYNGDGKKLISKTLPPKVVDDLRHLLTKKYYKGRGYDPKAKKQFKKLVDLGRLPPEPRNSKYQHIIAVHQDPAILLDGGYTPMMGGRPAPQFGQIRNMGPENTPGDPRYIPAVVTPEQMAQFGLRSGGAGDTLSKLVGPLSDRLDVVMGIISAGNNSHELIGEALKIIDRLGEAGVMDRKLHKKLFKWISSKA